MMKRRTVIAVCVLLALAGALPVALTSTGIAATTSISAGSTPTADPSGSITTAPGESVTVVVWANATTVSAYQATLTFDPAVVEVASVSGTADFGDPVANANNSAGRVAFNQLRGSAASDPVLATITFTVVGGAGETTEISFVEAATKFATEDGETFDPGEYADVVLRIEDPTSTPTPTSQPGTGPDPIDGFENAPTDPDGDGKYEDINGDGDVNVGDAQAIFANAQDPVVQNNVAAFDFNDDGSVNVGDAQALFANGLGV